MNAPTPALPTVIGGRFEILSKLAETGLSVVHRARDQSDGTVVVLKQLRREVVQADPESVHRFRREATLLAGLQHDHIVRVIAFGVEDGLPFLATELIDGKPLDELVAKRALDITASIRLVAQIADGLAYVHRRGLIHRDIKPQNVLVSTEGPSPIAKLIDFGLAQGARGSADTAVVGTFMYMPPEQAGLMQRPVGPRSDLYSLGCAAWEMLTGRPAFDATDPGELFRQIQSVMPPSIRSIVPDVPVVVERIITRLLQKNPDDRYQSARSLQLDLSRVLADLDAGRAIGTFELDKSGTSLHDKIGTIFVGRTAELSACSELITKVADGQPQLILVGGRSGVGKSAFVNELYTRGLARGLTFAQGKCYAIHAGLPYFALGEALEELHAQLKQRPSAVRSATAERLRSELGANAAHLVNIAPAWRAVFPNAGQAKYEGEEKEREALTLGIAAVLRALSGRGAPLALFLDDLQWADSGTLAVMQRLQKELFQQCVLLVGAYRSEEVGPNHAVTRLIGALDKSEVFGRSVALEPLTADEVGILLQRLLNVPPPPELVTVLNDRSGGNAFFVWELLRAFINGGVIVEREDGTALIDLEKLTTIELPKGLLDVVVRRIAGLDAEAQRIIGVASMVGEAFTTEMLAEILGIDAGHVFAGLSAAQQAGLIAPENAAGRSTYAFTHDKVLEASEALVPNDEVPVLHRKIGELFERSGSDDPDNAEYIFKLAAHFTRGDDEERALKYALLAGDKARTLLKNDDALRSYEQAEALLAGKGAAAADRRRDVVVKRAEVLDTMGNYADAEKGYTQALTMYTRPADSAPVLVKLAYMQQKASRLQDSHANLLKALSLLGERLQLEKRLGLELFLARARMLWVTFLVALTGLFRRGRVADKVDERKALVTEILTRLWYFHAFHDAGKHNIKMILLGYRLLASALRTGETKELSVAHRLMAVTLCQGRHPNFPGAVKAAFKSVEVARRLQLKMELAQGYLHIGAVNVWQNTPAQAVESLQRSQEMLEQIGNLWDLVNVHIFLYMSYRARGRLDEALANALEIVRIGEKANAPASIASGSMKVGELLILKGEKEQGERYLKKALEIAEEKKLQFDGFNAHKTKGRLLIREGRFEEARAHFAKAVALTEGNNFMRAYVSDSYIGWAEAVVRDSKLDTAMESSLFEKADAYLKQAEEAERHYRNHYAYALRIRALLQARRGDDKGAAATIARAARTVEENDLVSDRAPLLEDQATILQASKPEEAKQLRERAKKIYEDLGANGEVERLGGRELKRQKVEVRNESMLTSLLEVTVATASHRDLADQARAALDALVRVFDAERAFLFLTDDEGKLKLQAGREKGGKDLSELTAYSTTVVEKVRTDRKPVVLTSTEDGASLGSQSAVVYNLRSIMSAPLLWRDTLLGVVYLDNKLERGLRTETELQVFQAIASQIAVFVETTRATRLEIERQALASEKALLEKDVALTATVQQLFLPGNRDFARPGANIAGFYRSATQCGGDWWWLETRRPKSLVIYVGDVMGHGVAPAMVTASVSTAYQLLTRDNPERPVAEVLAELNTNLVSVCHGQYYMTMSAVEVRDDGAVRWWNAGAPPLLLLENPEKGRPVQARGSPLGSGELTLGTADFRLEPGQRLLIFTDGLTELDLPGGKMLGQARLSRELVKLANVSVADSRTKLVEMMDKARADVPQGDDLTFVIVERPVA